MSQPYVCWRQNHGAGRRAAIEIRQLSGDRFQVNDSVGKHVAPSGEPNIVVIAGVDGSLSHGIRIATR